MARMDVGRWLAIAVLAATGCSRMHPSTPVPGAGYWTGSWTASPQLTEPRNMPPAPGLSGNTLRQVVRLSLGGSAIRVRLSNDFGREPLTVNRAQVALSATGSAIVAGSGRALTFDGSDAITIAAGASAVSDAIGFPVPALSSVTVSLQLGAVPAGLTGHPGSRTTSYLAAGNQVSADSLPSAVRVEHWYLLSDIEVLSARTASSVVILGNSIADGRGSITDQNNRWPDNLARRLHDDPRTSWVGVLNAGIGGNAVIRGGLGPTALERLGRDVLQQRGARWLVVSHGVNDIGAARSADAAQAVAGQLIEAYQQIITRSHAAKLRVYGATILPFGGSQYDDAHREAARQRVNEWIRSAAAFDAVIDFDAAMRNPSAPTRLRPELDGGDHLHPNAAGYVVMAEAIDLRLFEPARETTGLRLARVFGDGVVLQRGVRLPIWGWARPGARVTLELAGRRASTTSSPNGSWRVELPPLVAGGPHVLEIEAGGERLRVQRILVGDVWLAAGQSNMEFKLAAAIDGVREIAAAGDSALRSFRVPHAWSDTALADLPGGQWVVADQRHAGGFSAVAWFFAREVRAAARVPVGIIDVSWGGSAIETWMSREASGLDERGWKSVATRERDYQSTIRAALERRLGGLPAADGGIVGGRAVWSDPAFDDAAWETMQVPGAWERAGLPGLDGVAWYRLTLALSARDAAAAAVLSVGAIDDADVTWVNGVEVGRTDSYNAPRRYTVPPGVLREGPNTIAIRVSDGGGEGGVVGLPSQLYLALDGQQRPLAGPWKFKVGAVSQGTDEQHINKIPTVAYNGMISPLRSFPVRGVIWYQGESNANSVAQAAAYRAQFSTLIQNWRRELHGYTPDFPFLWVQLPNYGAVDSLPPAEAGWATLRESQHAALRLPRTGEAVAIDQGDPVDIHPRDKRVVGHRLALAARSVAYAEAIQWRSPEYRRHSVAEGEVTVEFSHAESGLDTRDGAQIVSGFALAGADRHWVWADARIVGSRVVVSSHAVRSPVAVRYAWSNSPAKLNLYSAAGLPVVPFRTDRW